MKKGFLAFFMTLFLCACNSVIPASEDIIVPLFSTNSTSQNKIWIGTFQLVFNDMKNNILGQDIYFEGEKPTYELKGLNSEEFNSSMLNESSYYTSYGETSPEAKDKIKQDIKQKFNETSDIIDNMDWTRGYGKYYAYAMLKKEFEFINEFDKLDSAKFNNSENKFAYFGIKNGSKEVLRDNLRVLFYNNEDDYAVCLMTKSGDLVYLYRTEENASLKDLYKKMLHEENNFEGSRQFAKIDTLKVPNLKFKKMREYKELCNKIIRGTDNYFAQAIETVQFELDNKGGKVKSEAAIMMEATAIFTPDVQKPRNFNFDKTFAMFLVDSGKDDAYMALRIQRLDDFVK